MREEIRHQEYVKQLLEARKEEVIKRDPLNERNIALGKGLTSPTSNLSTEETRILKEYMDQQNLFKVTEAAPDRKKNLTLKKFFKMKRNQQVEVYSKNGDKSIYTLGKVTSVGRDFVMLTNLKSRYWIPYQSIESANIPFGIPNYSNTHQHFLYDNQLREKLVLNFGETVSKREELYQLFNEDSLRTSLSTWKGSWVEISTADYRIHGKIVEVTNNLVKLSSFGKMTEIELTQISYIQTLRLYKIMTRFIKGIFSI